MMIVAHDQMTDLSEIDPRVEACLSLFMQRVLHCPRLELLLGPEGFLLVKDLTEFGQIHLDYCLL